MVYIPPGRIRKQIDPKSVNGRIEVSFAEIYSGMLEGIKLEFKEGALKSWSAKRNANLLNNLIEKIAEEKRQMAYIEIGMNPLMKYGYAQDRFVSGAITMGLPRMAGVISNASLIVKGITVAEKGKILA